MEECKKDGRDPVNIERPFRHKVEVQLRFNDFDMLGHMNNTSYFSCFDLGKSSYFNTVRGNSTFWSKIDIVVASIKCDFIAPVTFNEPIEVRTQVACIHDKSFNVVQALANSRTGQVKCVCTTVMVGYDVENKVAKALSQEWKEAIAAYESFPL